MGGGKKASKWTATQLQLNAVQDSKGRPRELLVTNYKYGFALTGSTFESSIVEPVDDCGKAEFVKGLAVS